MPTYVVNAIQTTYEDNLFQRLYNAFVDDEYEDFVFQFPFSNETVTIPADYIETHLPSVIINLIRLFYWYMIGIFIFKDIMRVINKIKSGNFWLQDEKNIKTEVL